MVCLMRREMRYENSKPGRKAAADVDRKSRQMLKPRGVRWVNVLWEGRSTKREEHFIVERERVR